MKLTKTLLEELVRETTQEQTQQTGQKLSKLDRFNRYRQSRGESTFDEKRWIDLKQKYKTDPQFKKAFDQYTRRMIEWELKQPQQQKAKAKSPRSNFRSETFTTTASATFTNWPRMIQQGWLGFLVGGTQGTKETERGFKRFIKILKDARKANAFGKRTREVIREIVNIFRNESMSFSDKGKRIDKIVGLEQ